MTFLDALLISAILLALWVLIDRGPKSGQWGQW